MCTAHDSRNGSTRMGKTQARYNNGATMSTPVEMDCVLMGQELDDLEQARMSVLRKQSTGRRYEKKHAP